ncbi:MAG: class I SAM-dependent methyltransferase [Peptococcaceae bacterium]
MAQSINTIRLLHQSLQLSIKEGAFCIDATAGKGHDTVFLANLAGSAGKVLAMDIQPQALEAAAALVHKQGLQQVEFVLDGHEHMAQYAEAGTVDCIVFNLGYLPGGDHAIATKADTTIAALEQGLELLKPLGIISLAIYHGGDTGFAERDAVLQWLKQLDHKQYTVLVTDFYNRPNYPPLAVQIIKEKNPKNV